MPASIISVNHTILRVLVGSHAHGLAGPESDKDFRSVLAFRFGTRKANQGEKPASLLVVHVQLALGVLASFRMSPGDLACDAKVRKQ